jgi:aldehyde dehydrogenase (NAD+)
LVMKAAANHLAGVTLELGGKSPVVIDRRVNMAQVAKRLAWAKLLNAGQICVAPDYIFVHEDDREAFLSEIQRVFRQLYGAHPNESNDYQRIITPHHARRIEGLISEAVAGGARLVLGGQDRPEDCYIEPTVLTDIPVGASILDEEIFGPVMPVLTYRSLDEVVSFARARPIPLTINIYSRRRRTIRRLMRDIPSGTVSINQGVVHVGHSGLPFGGLGNSGVGVSHGEAAFHSFTHQRGVYQQILPGAVELLRAPYTAFSRRLVRFVLRWL